MQLLMTTRLSALSELLINEILILLLVELLACLPLSFLGTELDKLERLFFSGYEKFIFFYSRQPYPSCYVTKFYTDRIAENCLFLFSF